MRGSGRQGSPAGPALSGTAGLPADAGAPASAPGSASRVLAAGLAMIILDGTVVNVALPAIVDELDLALSDAQWVSCLYAVIFAALLLT